MGTERMLQLVVGAVMISFSAVFVKLAHVGPTMAGFYRMLFGGIFLSVLILLKGERPFHGQTHLLIVLLCSILFALDLTFWHRSIHYVGPGLSTLLANFQVFFLALIGVTVFRERLTWRSLVSIPLAMTGLYLIVGLAWDTLGHDYRMGVFFGLLAAVCYTAYILSLRKCQSMPGRPSTLSTIALICLFTATIMAVEGLLQDESFRIPDLQTLGALAAYGIVSQVLGWVFISVGVPKVQPSRVGLILLLQPALSFVWDVLFFKRPIRLVEVMGAGLALFAIYLGTGRNNERGKS